MGGLLPEKLGGGVLPAQQAFPYEPNVLNAKTPSRGPLFRSARTGTLATPARGVRPSSQNPHPIYDQNLRYSLS